MILAESGNYIICSEYEAAYLINKVNGQKYILRDMYGEPAACKISRDM